MLRLYRRHRALCPHSSERYRRCSCPIYVDGSLSGVSYCLIGPFQALYHGLASRYWKAPPLTGTVS